MDAAEEPNVPDEQLRRMAAIADPGLAHLDAQALLDEVLDRIMGLLGVDSVAVYMFDTAAQQLVARAGAGVDAALRPGARFPIGNGFARRVSTEKMPVVDDEIDPRSPAHAPLVAAGVGSMVGVPLIAAGEVIGMMHAAAIGERWFTDTDGAFLQFAADRLAVAIAAHQATSDQSAARILQRSLLPQRLPDVAGLEFAARFVPAEEFGVGGDWYDTFVLPSGHVGIVMGDVAGSGLRAAVVMGRLRSVLRAYAFVSDSPAEVLDRVDRKFTHFEPDELATVLYAVIDPSLERITVASAGHPPPVISGADGIAEFVDVHPGPPIGAHIRSGRENAIVELPAGAIFGCYTDGLIERRNEGLDDGLQRLRAAFLTGPVESVCNRVMARLLDTEGAADDTALLVVRRLG